MPDTWPSHHPRESPAATPPRGQSFEHSHQGTARRTRLDAGFRPHFPLVLEEPVDSSWGEGAGLWAQQGRSRGSDSTYESVQAPTRNREQRGRRGLHPGGDSCGH